ncbi:MAG: exodeoxyribonuclease III [Thermodesulfobacteriota bacterium]|nr:exodeoxyribonuclease III [Thermodesulfobacteriota bacterium]
MNLESFVLALEQEVASYHTPVVDLIAVQTRDPYKVLVATMLSARTRDETTAKASARLFKEAPDIHALAELSEAKIRKLIQPVGFFNNKARYLHSLPGALKPYTDKVPDELDELLKLPGVGRKTANLVLSVAFDKPAICVDTHVHRIMNIWGFVNTKHPEATEKALRKILPVKYWKRINSILVTFGQERCKPVGPQCDRCLFEQDCPKIGVTPRRVKSKGGDTMKFISWNVNGLRAVEKKGFVDVVKGIGADIFAVQETRVQSNQLSEELKNIDGYSSYFAQAKKKGYSGVGVYTRQKPLSVTVGIGMDQFDDEGRVLTLEFANFFLINAYFPNAQHELKRIDYKLAFNHALFEYAKKLAGKKSSIICGDFNVAHKAIDLANPKANEKNPGYSIEERNWMDSFINAGWVDTFRVFNQNPGQYSWWSYRFNARSKNIGWRIDYFVIDENSKSRIHSAAILSDILGSDHCPVQLKLKTGLK